MPITSELFHISRRRSRSGLPRHLTTTLDSSPERSFPRHHTTNRRHHHRRDIDDGFGDPPRSHQRPRPPIISERDTVRVDEGIGRSSLGNNRSNSDNYPGVRRRGGRHIGNDRLPGTVLVARERLLERLRGVSLSANGRSDTPTVHSNRNVLTVGDDFRLFDANGDYSDTETSRESLVRDLPFTDSMFQTGQLSVTQATRSKRKPPGLTQEALARLHLEVFNSCDAGEVTWRASQECSICLENFAEGDELVRLPCAHGFHLVCLDPWVRTCGDCPYCRREIVVSCN